MTTRLLWLALAGAAGTLARYGIAGLIQRYAGASFPWGTLAVNVSGCFMAGTLWSLFEYRWPVSGEVRAVALIGFMGALTTFSGFALETSELLRAAEWLRAAGNILAQNGLGLAALLAGLALGRLL